MRPLRWYRAQIQVPADLLGGAAVFRLDATGLGKGMDLGQRPALGRHWLVEAASPPSTFSQRYYHVPADWLKPANELVILEEQSASPAKVQLQTRS